MSKSKGFVFCAVVMLLVAAGPASAQSQVSERMTANAMIGVGQSRAGTSFDTIGAVGVKAHPNVQIVGEVGTLDFRRYIGTSQVAVDTHRAIRYGGNVIFTYSRPMTVQPFLLGGFGSLRTDDRAGGNRNDPYVNVGLGFDFWVTEWVGVGMQYRSYFVDKGTIHYFNSGIKIGLH